MNDVFKIAFSYLAYKVFTGQIDAANHIRNRVKSCANKIFNAISNYETCLPLLVGSLGGASLVVASHTHDIRYCVPIRYCVSNRLLQGTLIFGASLVGLSNLYYYRYKASRIRSGDILLPTSAVFASAAKATLVGATLVGASLMETIYRKSSTIMEIFRCTINSIPILEPFRWAVEKIKTNSYTKALPLPMKVAGIGLSIIYAIKFLRSKFTALNGLQHSGFGLSNGGSLSDAFERPFNEMGINFKYKKMPKEAVIPTVDILKDAEDWNTLIFSAIVKALQDTLPTVLQNEIMNPGVRSAPQDFGSEKLNSMGQEVCRRAIVTILEMMEAYNDPDACHSEDKFKFGDHLLVHRQVPIPSGEGPSYYNRSERVLKYNCSLGKSGKSTKEEFHRDEDVKMANDNPFAGVLGLIPSEFRDLVYLASKQKEGDVDEDTIESLALFIKREYLDRVVIAPEKQEGSDLVSKVIWDEFFRVDDPTTLFDLAERLPEIPFSVLHNSKLEISIEDLDTAEAQTEARTRMLAREMQVPSLCLKHSFNTHINKIIQFFRLETGDLWELDSSKIPKVDSKYALVADYTRRKVLFEMFKEARVHRTDDTESVLRLPSGLVFAFKKIEVELIDGADYLDRSRKEFMYNPTLSSPPVKHFISRDTVIYDELLLFVEAFQDLPKYGKALFEKMFLEEDFMGKEYPKCLGEATISIEQFNKKRAVHKGVLEKDVGVRLRKNLKEMFRLAETASHLLDKYTNYTYLSGFTDDDSDSTTEYSLKTAPVKMKSRVLIRPDLSKFKGIWDRVAKRNCRFDKLVPAEKTPRLAPRGKLRLDEAIKSILNSISVTDSIKILMRDQFKVTTPYDVTQTSCFYRAIGSEIFRGRSWNGVDTLALRKAVSIYIEQAVMSGNDEYIQNWLAVEGGNKSLDVHLGEIERGGYANSIAIYVMSQLIQRPIHIFYFSNKATNLKISITRTLVDEAGWIIPTQIVGGEFDADPIRLLLINNVHFHVMTYIH